MSDNLHLIYNYTKISQHVRHFNICDYCTCMHWRGYGVFGDIFGCACQVSVRKMEIDRNPQDTEYKLNKGVYFFRLCKAVRYSSQDHLLGTVIKLRSGRSNNSVPFTGEQALSARSWRALCCPRCSVMFSAEAFEMRKSLLTLSLLKTGLKNYEPFIYGDTHYITSHYITLHYKFILYVLKISKY